MHALSPLYASLVLVGYAVASPQFLAPRAGCAADNLLNCFTKSATLASSFCSSTLGVTTVTTATAVATSTTTTIVTVTGDAPSSGITEAAIVNRAASAPTAPACVASSNTYPASRITSACACIGVTQRTQNAIYTISTATVTETSTTYVPAQASSSPEDASTGSSSTCPISNPAFVNGGFESGNTNGWLILETVNGNGVTFKTTTTRAHSGQYSMDIMPNYYNNWAPQSITVGTYLATVPGTVYALSFWLWTGGWTFHSAGINGRTFMTDDKGIDSWTQYNTTFTAVGQDLMTITASAGDWQYAELFLDDFAAVPAS